jgi:hypothetical protein
VAAANSACVRNPAGLFAYSRSSPTMPPSSPAMTTFIVRAIWTAQLVSIQSGNTSLWSHARAGVALAESPILAEAKRENGEDTFAAPDVAGGEASDAEIIDLMAVLAERLAAIVAQGEHRPSGARRRSRSETGIGPNDMRRPIRGAFRAEHRARRRAFIPRRETACRLAAAARDCAQAGRSRRDHSSIGSSGVEN